MKKISKNSLVFSCMVYACFLHTERLTADISGLIPGSLPHVPAVTIHGVRGIISRLHIFILC